jgi:hypothetical protein
MAKIHRLSLDETGGTFADSIGALSGTRSGVTTIPGLFGNAQRATTTSHTIAFGDTVSDIRFTTGDFSFRTVFRVSTASATNRWLWGRWNWSAAKRAYGLYLDSSNNLGFYASSDGTAFTFYNSAAVISDTLWHDCVVTRNGTTLTVYVDGTEVFTTGSFYASIYDDPGNIGFDICNIVTADSGAVNVDIDQLEIWNEELTASYIEGMLYSPVATVVLTDLDPAADQKRVAVDDTVILAVESTYDIDLSTVIITIEGTIAYQSSAFQNSFTGTVTGPATKKTFDITPPSDFPYKTQIDVDVYAEDIDAGFVDTSYSFYTNVEIVARPPSYGRRADADTGTVFLARMDEQSGGPVDSSSFNLNVVNYGTAAIDVPPGTGDIPLPFSRCRAFNANDQDYIIPGSGTETYLHLTTFTVDLWASVADSFPDGGSFQGDPDVGYCLASGTGWALYLRGPRSIPFSIGTVYADIGGVTHEAEIVTEIGQWHHYALTVTPSEVAIFRDGVKLVSGTGTTLSYAPSDPTALGCKIVPGPVTTYHHRGYIADARMSSFVRRIPEFYNSRSALVDPQTLFNVDADSTAVYNFDDAAETDALAVDSTGGFNNGVVAGYTPGQAVVPGPYSTNSRSFNGGTTITIPDSTDFSTNQPFTLECYFTPGAYVGTPPAYPPTALPDQFRLIGKEDTGGSTKQFVMETDASKRRLVFVITGNLSVLVVSPPESMHEYQSYYVVCTFDPTTKTVKMYIDGALVSEDTAASLDPSTAQDTTPVIIGDTDTSSRPYTGMVHAIRFSSVVKTAKQIYDTFHGSDIAGAA